MNRIEKNEAKLDKLNDAVFNLDKQLDIFEPLINEFHELNKYYGSKEWFKDKKEFEKGKIKNIKAGVLSEDAVWNLDEKVSGLTARMEEIVLLLKPAFTSDN